MTKRRRSRRRKLAQSLELAGTIAEITAAALAGLGFILKGSTLSSQALTTIQAAGYSVDLSTFLFVLAALAAVSGLFAFRRLR